MISNILDPEVIVLGGGLSQLEHIYEDVPGRMVEYIFSNAPAVKLVPPAHGDASGARGAARLW